MASSVIASSDAKQAITGARAQRILRAAADGHVTMTLRAGAWAIGERVDATILSIDAEALIVRVSESDASKLRESIGALDADFSIDGGSYSLTTSVDREGDQSGGIRMALPDELTISQRRRARRYRLARARVVEVRDPSGGDLLCTATLLNLSPDGIAAKTGDALTDRCRIGQSCRVRFRLDDDAPDFELPARITNITPAGDPGQAVLGMEFVRGDRFESTRTRISEALSRLNPPAVGGVA